MTMLEMNEVDSDDVRALQSRVHSFVTSLDEPQRKELEVMIADGRAAKLFAVVRDFYDQEEQITDLLFDSFRNEVRTLLRHSTMNRRQHG
jgi:hypothetical protein